MQWIYLSPHLDDTALSCGGLIWDQVQAGQDVEVWTLCAGDPPPHNFSAFAEELHARWALSPEAAIAARREEDRQAMAVLGAPYRHFSIPDAIYRLHPKTGELMYFDWEDVTGGLHPGDEGYLRQKAQELAGELAGEVSLVSPLTVGNHVDHQFTRVLAEMLGLPLLYYPDYPYTMQYDDQIPYLLPTGAKKETFAVSPQGLAAWQDSVAAYASQISTFWASEAEMRDGIRTFSEQFGGVPLFKSSQ
ncbi:MAG TPA: PIG-L family deacetylase [Anaerolineales bacterium]|nr:PIG-L family deacetylase [Anaerolineales bacterium]